MTKPRSEEIGTEGTVALDVGLAVAQHGTDTAEKLIGRIVQDQQLGLALLKLA
jgi:hypothetical protein